MSSVVITISVPSRLIVIRRVFTIILRGLVLFLTMSALTKFNQVEQALKNIVESVLGPGRVSIGLYSPTPQFPRAIVYAESVSARDVALGSRWLEHTWRFAVEIWAARGSEHEAYDEIKRLFWAVYDAIMSNRTLGVGNDVFVTPAVDSTLEGGRTDDQRFGFRWTMHVLVRVASL